jgi:hypothetical protein
MLDGLPRPAREALVAATANDAGSRAERQERLRTAFEANAVSLRAAGQVCVAQFGWSTPQQDSAIQAFQYALRLEASVIRLQANGLTEQAASEMFETLPTSTHEAIFGKRQMTPDESQLLQAAFEKLVGEHLDGPSGNALSEYITARAGHLYYARELESQ